MADAVKADGVVIYHKMGSSYYPIACGTSATISVTTDKIELAPFTAGRWRNYEYSRTTGTISTSGLIKIDAGASNYSPFDLHDYQLGHLKVLTKYVITDPQSNSKTYEVSCLVDDFTINTDAGGQATYSMSMTMVSDPTFIQTPVPPGGTVVNAYEFFATGGETTISNSSLIGVQILDVRRNGIGLDVVTSGTPTGSQAKFTSGSGSLEFGMALGASEWILVIYVT